MILGVFSELGSFGGIQQVSRHAGATLCELAARRGEACELLGLNDPAGEGKFLVGDQQFPCLGFARNKAKFVTHLMARAPRTRLLFAGHIHLGPPALAAATLCPALRFWLVTHGMEVWEPLPLYRVVPLRKARGIVAVSRNTAETVVRVQKVAREKIAVLRPALEPGAFLAATYKAQLAVPPGSRVLLTVGRLLASEPGKGVDTVIQALPRLLPAFPDLYYVVVGDGDGRPSLENLAAGCGVSDRIIFAGAKAAGSLRGYYEAADIYVMPSRQEGFGIVFLEAMAAGKPVVASACGGAQEVVREGEEGFLVEYGDIPALAERLTRLLADDHLRQRMGEAGRRKTEQEHRFDAFRERLIALLEASQSPRPER